MHTALLSKRHTLVCM